VGEGRGGHAQFELVSLTSKNIELYSGFNLKGEILAQDGAAATPGRATGAAAHFQYTVYRHKPPFFLAKVVFAFEHCWISSQTGTFVKFEPLSVSDYFANS
jgi:hypothetical protein